MARGTEPDTKHMAKGPSQRQNTRREDRARARTHGREDRARHRTHGARTEPDTEDMARGSSQRQNTRREGPSQRQNTWRENYARYLYTYRDKTHMKWVSDVFPYSKKDSKR